MTDLKKASVKSKVEAVLFSTGHKISLDEISKICRSRKEDVLLSLQELQKEYDEKQSSLMLVEEGEFWKFTVRDHLISIVRKIVTETELTKSVLETLAVIAFKYPILQSDLIKLRTNKSYDHLAELEKSGYISRQKHGRTNLIKLTEKFFKYFDLTEEQLRDRFKDFGSIARAIHEKEDEVKMIKDDQRKKAEDLKKEDEKIRQEIEALDKAGEDFNVPLETYESKSNENISGTPKLQENLTDDKEKIGDLVVVDSEQMENSEKEDENHEIGQITVQEKEELQTESTNQPLIQEKEMTNFAENKVKSEIKENFEKPFKTKTRKHKQTRGIKLSPEMEAKVDEKVNEMLGLSEKEEDKEGNKENL